MGLSRRGYSRSRNISEAAVRKHIAAGTIPVEADDTIDPDKADKALAGSITRPKAKRVPAVLATAKMRHQRAIARDLQDQQLERARALVDPRYAANLINEMFGETNAIIRKWPEKIAPTLLGRNAEEAQRLLKRGVNDLLGELHQFVSHPRQGPKSSPQPEPDLDAMTAVQLQAHAEHLRARLLELGRWERQRKLVRVADVTDLQVEALVTMKSLMTAIPGRTDVQVAGAADLDAVLQILNKEVDGVVAAAHLDLSPITKE